VHPVVSAITGRDEDGLPQTSSREADTTVRLQKGEELVIGGLDREELTTVLRKVPILGDIPVLGELFRTRSRTSTRTEIIVLIRAYPVFAGAAPPDATERRKELR
jgi:type II secretory pathway component GspD/PulD (secretin)